MFASVQAFCSDDALTTRLYAFQVLETILRRAVTITQRQHRRQTTPEASEPTVTTLEALTPSTLVALTTQVLLNWEHPSKRVNQFMAQMFVHVVAYQALATAAFPDWRDATVRRLVELPPQSRAKYGALAVLLPASGGDGARARELLHTHPQLLASVLRAVGLADVSAAAAGVFAQLLDALPADSDALWLDSVVAVLLADDASVRAQVAMHVVPLLVKKDPGCVRLLVNQLRSSASASSADTRLWAILEVLKLARKRLAPEKLLGLESAVEIDDGLAHAAAETRSSAFDALCASLKSTTMPTARELRLVQTFLALHGKEISSASRLNTLIGLKNVFLRVHLNARVSGKATTATADVLATQREDAERARAFQRWLELFVVTTVTSGALPQRQILGLSVLQLYVQVFGFHSDNDSDSDPTASLLLTPHMVTTLLNMLTSAWDVIRSLAYSVLDLYPAALPGYSSATELSLLLKWAMTLCDSARQRESDAGGLFMRLLFKKSAAIAQHGIAFQPTEATAVSPTPTVQSPQAAFVLQLADVILTRLSDTPGSTSDASPGEQLALVHGLLLSLRYIVEIVDFEALRQSTDRTTHDEWAVAIDRVFQCVRRAMRSALFVVGDATAGAEDDNELLVPGSSSELSSSSAVVVGEVNSLPKTDAIPLRVDCRGHLILEHGEVGADQNDTAQRAVMGSWLAARECGAILDVLMRRVPTTTTTATAATSSSRQLALLTTEMAQEGGEMLLYALFELKHKGAVATAYQAFEGVCRSFLAHGETNPTLGALPMAWADRLLDRLERSEQHFILRRSSGFAYSFVAILRAEPRNAAAVILPKVMATLLRLAGLDTDVVSSSHDQHLRWRSRVHALNILKLVCQDAILADDVSVYVATMLELAVRGFDCSSWAVRNSAMMLFAAATQRAIGDKRIADGGSTLKVSSVDVFSRFQQLHGFIVRELTKYTAVSSSSSPYDATPPPGLYPILVFMSRLKPGDEDAGAASLSSSSSSSLAAFVPLVRQCASQPTMALRQMTAKVLATITRDDDAAALLRSLTAQLPNGVRSAAASHVTEAEPQPPRVKTTTNSVHGVLTQIQYLVAKYLSVESAALAAVDARRAQAVQQIVQLLASELFVSKLWLWTSPALASGVLRATFLDIVALFVAHCYATSASTLSDEVEHAVGVILAQCAKDLKDRCRDESSSATATATLSAGASSAPGQYVSDRALVSILFSTWKLRKVQWQRKTGKAAPGDVLPLVEHLLESPVLVVRKRAIKQLAVALRGDAHLTLTLSDNAYESLRAVLTAQLLVETHPKVKARQLALLVHCQSAHDVALPATTRVATQTALLAILEQSVDADVLAPALELLALTVRQDEYADATVCAQLRQELVTRASELQPVVLRQAAARALRHSGFLTLPTDDAASWTTEVVVDSWLSALTLLQDDEPSTRALVSKAVQLALAPAPVRPISDTRVLPQAIAYVVKHFMHSAYGAAALSRLFLSLVDAPSVLHEYARDDQDWGDLCDQIFEAESSNFFAEPDLVAQLLVYHLFVSDAAVARQQRPRANSSGLFGFGSGATSSSSSTVASEALAAVRTQVLERLVETLTLLARDDAREHWIGGVTYYARVFAPLVSLLTAGVAVARGRSQQLVGAAEKKLVAQVAKLAREGVARLETVHPVLRSALELLSRAGKHKQRTLSSGEVASTTSPTVANLLYLTPFWDALSDE